MGDITGMTTSKEKISTVNKIFRGNIYILQVEGISSRDNRKKVIWKCKKPNTEFTPPLCSLAADENDSQAMAVYGGLFQHFKQLLTTTVLKFPDKQRRFFVTDWMTRDLKCWSRLLGKFLKGTLYQLIFIFQTIFV